MKIHEIISRIHPLHVSSCDEEMEITGLTQDSRKVRPGMAFIAIKGTEIDGHIFLDDAVERGASVIICEESYYTEKDTVCVMEVEHARAVLGPLAQAFEGDPANDLRVIGITGTNGKTTTSTLVYQILSHAGKNTSLLGTVSKRILQDEFSSSLTTADPIELASDMKMMASAGSEFLVMEVSSHALHQFRVSGFNFEIAAFTNLSHDHLDYHRTMENYADAKKMLFDSLPEASTAVINDDDHYGMHMVRNCASVLVGVSLNSDLYEIIEESAEGLTLRVRDMILQSPLVGTFNAYNLAIACEIARATGLNDDEIKAAARKATGAAGRMERVTGSGGSDPVVIVDYAHTPDALRNVIETLMQLKSGHEKLTVLFGAGGNRDRSKRPEMAKAASLADKVVVSSDNPRFEQADTIIADIMAGFEDTKEVVQITDRREAIQKTILEAAETDIILIAGKGHEDYQEINGEKHPFDDRQIAREALKQRGGGN